MNRRELLQRSAIVLGGSLFGADSLLAKNVDWDAIEGLPDGEAIGLFSKSQVKLLNEIAETIIPTTSTPGAKAAKTGQFMATIVSDCYEAPDQTAFLAGLQKLDQESKSRYGKTFLKCRPQLRHDLLTELDTEQRSYNQTRKSGDPRHYFRVMKDLVLWGYFSSEIGATQALRYVPVPGRYETIEYKKGDRSFAG